MSICEYIDLGSSKKFYKQCLLEKNDHYQVSWIPEEFAHKDKYIKLKDDDGWKVIEVGSKATESQVFGMQVRDFRSPKKGKKK